MAHYKFSDLISRFQISLLFGETNWPAIFLFQTIYRVRNLSLSGPYARHIPVPNPDRPDHTLSLLGTVVVSNDRCDTIVQSEYRHEEEALKLKVYTEYSSCGRRKLDQDAVHRIGHDWSDRLHNNRRNTNCINVSDQAYVRTESFEA